MWYMNSTYFYLLAPHYKMHNVSSGRGANRSYCDILKIDIVFSSNLICFPKERKILLIVMSVRELESLKSGILLSNWKDKINISDLETCNILL